MDKLIKITLSILFLLCLINMPYGYYQFVRFVVSIGFAILAYQANEKGRHTEMTVYGALGLLFQPFFRIALGRGIWNVIDIVLAIGLIITIFRVKTDKRELIIVWKGWL